MRFNQPLRTSIATIVCTNGQHLRANEVVTAQTFKLTYAAKWAQATRGAK